MNELAKRLKASYGETKDRIVNASPAKSIKGTPARAKQVKAAQEKEMKEFDLEVIAPCDCSSKYHRICIREKIVQTCQRSCEE